MRLTQMNGVDLARFDFDYDNTWQAFFLDAKLNVYSRYGGRDASSPEARLSLASLRQTMEAVLEVHAQRRESTDSSDRAPAPTDASDRVFQRIPEQPRLPSDFPLLKQHHSGCLHCHQIQEYRLLQSFADGAFDSGLLFPFPLPENLGLEFDREHGYRVQRVREGGPAERAGVRSGDLLLRSGDNPIRSEEDFRWTLHHAPQAGALEIEVLRPGTSTGTDSPRPDRVTLTIELRAGWKLGDLSWRKSLRSYPVVWGFLGYSLGSEERRELDLSPDTLALKVVSIRGQATGVAQALGLRKGDLIVALEGERKTQTLEQFKSNLLGRYQPGSRMNWRVLREGREVSVKGVFPAWQTTDRTVP